MATENIRINYQVDKSQLESANKELLKVQEGNSLTQKEVDNTNGKFKEQNKVLATTNKAFAGLGGQLVALGNHINIAGKGMGDMAVNMFSATKAISGGSKALKIFRLALISTGIGALIVGLGSVVVYLTKFQSGINLVKVAFAGLNAIFDVVLGALGRFGKGLIEFSKGNISSGIDQMKKSFDGVGKSIKEAFNEGMDIEKARIELEKFNREAKKTSSELAKVIEINQAIADDATRSFKEREDANKTAMRSSEELAKINLEASKRNLEIINREIALKSKSGDVTSDLVEGQIDAQAQLIDAEKDYQLTFLDNEKVRRELKQDRLEKDLDILIDGFDNVKTINEKIIQNDKIALDERRKSFEELKKLSSDSFEEQVKTIQQFTGAQVDANDLIATSDAKVLNEKIRGLGLSEIIEGRLLEIIRERRTVQSDFGELEQKLNEDKEKIGEKEIEIQNRISEAVAATNIVKFEQQEKLIEAEIERRNFMLSNEELLAEEREFIIAESEAKIIAIKAAAADTQKQLDKEVAKSKDDAITQSLDLAKGLFNEQTVAYKAASIAQIGISTYKGAAAALEPPPIGAGPILGPILAGLTIASGLRSAAKVAGINPKFEKGGRIGGQRHRNGGTIIEAERDEFVMSRKATAKYGFDFMDKVNNLELNDLTAKTNGKSINIVDIMPIAKQLKEMPQNIINIDGEGFTLQQRRGHDIINRKLNRYTT